jgi:hypothetical protein
LCGNALDAVDFAALMGEERAAMVFTDPPYNVLIDGHASGLGAVHHRPFLMAWGETPVTVIIAGSESFLASYLLAALLYKIDDDIRLGPAAAHRFRGNAEPGAVRHGGVMPRA